MNMKKLMPITIGFGLILTALGLVIALEPEPVQQKTQNPIRQPVSVTNAEPQAYRPKLTLLGTTSARWQIEIRAQSSAELIALAPQTEPGTLVKQGDVLAKLDTTHLNAQLAQAHSAMKQAELNLKREQHEQTVALKLLTNRNSSSYARREPQIASAKAELKQARELYQSAQKYLQDATITAPFDAIILRRDVSPDQLVETGQVLFEIAASESLDIRVPVPERHWLALSRLRLDQVKPYQIKESAQIEVIDRQQQQWPAAIRYISPQAMASSRQREIVLAVEQPYRKSHKLLPNQQVRIEVALEQTPSVMPIPQSALTRDGQVWSVDGANKLRRESVTLVEQTAKRAYVIFTEQPDLRRQVVTYPLLSMLPGTEVDPQIADMMLANKDSNQ